MGMDSTDMHGQHEPRSCTNNTDSTDTHVQHRQCAEDTPYVTCSWVLRARVATSNLSPRSMSIKATKGCS